MPLKDPVARKEYQRNYLRKRYQEEPGYRTKHKNNVAESKARNKIQMDVLINNFKQNGCLICTESSFSCLCAHHLDGKEKDFNIAERRNHTPEMLKEELLKCVCLCHNCHSKLHANELEIIPK